MRAGYRARCTMLAVAAAALLSLAVGAPALATPAPSLAPQTAAAAPGDVVSAQRIYAPGFEYARVWHIKYLSTDTHGNAMTVSGTVVVPYEAYDGPRPIIGYAPGTHGMGDQCAPSARLKEGNDQEGGLIHQYGWQGYAVAVTDYQGLGTPGDHAYMVARAAGHALLDIVRAAQRLTDAGLPQNGPVGLAGYSQGGHAAAWGAQLAPGYARELSIKGVAAGGTPANLRQVAAYNEGRENFGLVLAAGVGMDFAYPELNLESYLNDAGRAGIEELRNGCDFGPYANKKISDYTTSDPLQTPGWQARLDQQNPGGSAPGAPVLLYHSTGDEIIPYSGATALRQRWCAQRANVTFRTYYFLEHAATAAYASPSVTSWMGDRLTGKATSGNCP